MGPRPLRLTPACLFIGNRVPLLLLAWFATYVLVFAAAVTASELTSGSKDRVDGTATRGEIPAASAGSVVDVKVEAPAEAAAVGGSGPDTKGQKEKKTRTVDDERTKKKPGAEPNGSAPKSEAASAVDRKSKRSLDEGVVSTNDANAVKSASREKQGGKPKAGGASETAESAKPSTKTPAGSENKPPSSSSDGSVPNSPEKAKSAVDSAKNESCVPPKKTRADKCYKILILSPICARSHNHVYHVLATALADRCHDVTTLISYPVKSDGKNKQTDQSGKGQQGKKNEVKQLSSPLYRELSEELFLFPLKKLSKYNAWNALQFVWRTMFKSASICERFLADPLTKRMLTDDVQEYDYILLSPHFDEECALAFIHLHRKRFGTPWGYVFPTTALPWANEAMGNPTLASTFPVQVLDFGDTMDFWQRAVNLVYTKYLLWMRWHLSYPRVEAVLRRDYDPEIGSLRELERTSSMYMLNIDERVFFYPYAKTSQTILVGGLHCKDAKPLPKDLEEWIQASGDHGMVLFSLGTFLKSKDMADVDRQKFVDAFSRLKQRVLWRWDGPPIPNLPSNVKLMSWIPQQDVLGHPKCKAFITHGGMLGTQEASYHGIPMVGFPIGADQFLNLGKTVRDRVGVALYWGNYTADSLHDAVRRVIEDPSYKANVRKRAALLKDQPETPLERAVWWVEYMARHRGADHYRPAARDLSWYQVYLLDVWLFFAVVGLLVAVFNVLLLRCCWRRLRRRSDAEEEDLWSSPAYGSGRRARDFKRD